MQPAVLGTMTWAGFIGPVVQYLAKAPGIYGADATARARLCYLPALSGSLCGCGIALKLGQQFIDAAVFLGP